MNAKPKEQMMMELVDDDVAIENRQRLETNTIMTKLTSYELLIQLHKHVEAERWHRYAMLVNGVRGTPIAMNERVWE